MQIKTFVFVVFSTWVPLNLYFTWSTWQHQWPEDLHPALALLTAAEMSRALPGGGKQNNNWTCFPSDRLGSIGMLGNCGLVINILLIGFNSHKIAPFITTTVYVFKGNTPLTWIFRFCESSCYLKQKSHLIFWWYFFLFSYSVCFTQFSYYMFTCSYNVDYCRE